MNKVDCLYNKHFFFNLYKYMVSIQSDTATDASNTVWHILDVEEILIKNHGYRRSDAGGII